MKKGALDGVFKNTKDAAVAKGDATTRAAREIIDREIAARDAQTARLRALRLAKEREDALAAEAVPPKKTRKSSTPA